MATNEDPFKEFPKISKLAKVLGKTVTTYDPTLRQWKRTLLPPIPIKEIYVGNRTYEVNNEFTKKKSMTLDEAIEHCKQKASSLAECNKECSLDHRQLAVWLSDLKALTKNCYGHYMKTIDSFVHDFSIAAIQGRLAANPTITSEEMAKLVANDVKYLLEELALNYRYVDFIDSTLNKQCT